MTTLKQLREVKEQIRHSDPMKEYEHNEDNNQHSRNVSHIANHVGTREDRIMSSHIEQAHNEIGHLPKALANHRDELHNKLYPLFVTKFGKK